MDAKTLEALKASIAKWEKNAVADDPAGIHWGGSDCPLCVMFAIRKLSPCDGCPVSKATGKESCYGTPYYGAEQAFADWLEGYGGADRAHAAARAEVAFLKSLLPAESE